MDLDTVVGVLVGILRVHTLCQRCERVSQLSETLLLLTLLRCQFTLTSDVVQRFVNIHVTRSLIEQRTTRIKLRLHQGQHIIDSRELDDRLTELLTLLGIGQSLVVSRLAQTYRLRGDTQTGTVHQGHHILDQT